MTGGRSIGDGQVFEAPCAQWDTIMRLLCLLSPVSWQTGLARRLHAAALAQAVHLHKLEESNEHALQHQRLACREQGHKGPVQWRGNRRHCFQRRARNLAQWRCKSSCHRQPLRGVSACHGG
eukprot:scaffold53231_cov30-Tisochrysis_lutea.AAC.7